jgi:hypothetical protein
MRKQDNPTNPEVREFAKELEMWAKKEKGREVFVKWLLTRTVSHEFEGTEGSFIIKRTDIEDFDIQTAVRHALAHCKPNPGLSTTVLTQGGPTWPKAYGHGTWPKAYGC